MWEIHNGATFFAVQKADNIEKHCKCVARHNKRTPGQLFPRSCHSGRRLSAAYRAIYAAVDNPPNKGSPAKARPDRFPRGNGPLRSRPQWRLSLRGQHPIPVYLGSKAKPSARAEMEGKQRFRAALTSLVTRSKRPRCRYKRLTDNLCTQPMTGENICLRLWTLVLFCFFNWPNGDANERSMRCMHSKKELFVIVYFLFENYKRLDALSWTWLHVIDTLNFFWWIRSS